jgi:hypothetical protein
MIIFEKWISQILGYAQFVSDDKGVKSAWIDGDFSCTSITNFDELYEQMFGDLDSGGFINRLNEFLPNSIEECKALSEFITSIIEIDEMMGQNKGGLSPIDLIQSDQWGRLVGVARRLLSMKSLSAIDPD